MSGTRANYFLIHRETGQRYPIKAHVTIGRMSGDIVFPRDVKLSAEHCRLIPIKGGIGVSDLDSANGTSIDGKRLRPKRVYLLKPKSELAAGDQVFALQSVSVALPIRKRKGRKRQPSHFLSTVLTVILFIAGVALFSTQWKKTESEGSLQVAQKELSDIFETYQDLRDTLDRQTAPASNIASRMQYQVLGRLANVQNRLTLLQPLDEKQKRLLSLQERFASALSAETQSQVLYLTSGETRYLDDYDQWADQVAQAAADFRKEADAHRINASYLPEPILPPIQIVEREMRQALRDYSKLGNQVQNHEVAEKDVGNLLRKQLIPKLMAVTERMGAIKPVGDAQAKRLALERSLVSAFLSQVKAMGIYYDTQKDPRYAKELDHWSDQIERINGALKKQLHAADRMPAAQ